LGRFSSLYKASETRGHRTENGFDQERDGRCIADIPELPGVLVYGNSRDEAAAKAQALALRVMADEIEKKGAVDLDLHFTFS